MNIPKHYCAQLQMFYNLKTYNFWITSSDFLTDSIYASTVSDILSKLVWIWTSHRGLQPGLWPELRLYDVTINLKHCNLGFPFPIFAILSTSK
jgi:hypothetical protein